MYWAQTTYPTGSGTQPNGLITSDLNGDSRADIIFSSSTNGYVSVLLNSGTGTFPTITNYSTGTGTRPYRLAAIDVNSDNKPDIITGLAGGNGISVLLNSGTGTFPTITNYVTGASVIDVAVGDVDSDGKVDVIAAGYSANNVRVLLNSGTGTFPTVTTYSTGTNTYPYCVTVVDMNGDSKLDIILGLYGSNRIAILLNSGSGTFPTITTYAAGAGMNSMAVVDVNSDNKLDVIITRIGYSNNLGVLLNSGTQVNNLDLRS